MISKFEFLFWQQMSIDLSRSVGQHAHSAYYKSNGVIMMHEGFFIWKENSYTIVMTAKEVLSTWFTVFDQREIRFLNDVKSTQ